MEFDERILGALSRQHWPRKAALFNYLVGACKQHRLSGRAPALPMLPGKIFCKKFGGRVAVISKWQT